MSVLSCDRLLRRTHGSVPVIADLQPLTCCCRGNTPPQHRVGSSTFRYKQAGAMDKATALVRQQLSGMAITCPTSLYCPCCKHASSLHTLLLACQQRLIVLLILISFIVTVIHIAQLSAGALFLHPLVAGQGGEAYADSQPKWGGFLNSSSSSSGGASGSSSSSDSPITRLLTAAVDHVRAAPLPGAAAPSLALPLLPVVLWCVGW
jgi:hypothetical protein